MPEKKENIIEKLPNSSENRAQIVDIGRENIGREPIPREIKTWMEKVEQASATQPQAIIDDNNLPPLVSITPQDQKNPVPITRDTFVTGFKKTWMDAGRWLSVFWLRFIKMKEGKVTFKSHDTN